LRRNGIALLITLAFVTAITALIALAGAVLQRGFSQASEKAFLVQSNVLLPEIYTILQQNSGDINDSTSLDIFLSLPLFFESKENGIMFDISFRSDASKVNINQLLLPQNTSRVPETWESVPMNPAVEAYLEQILTVYNVSDTILLISMIADTIDGDSAERAAGSEIALQNQDFMQGHIYNMQHFRQILDAYKRATLDLSVDAVPWERLIGFRNARIDFNHIEPEVLQAIDPTLDDGTVVELTTERTADFAQIGSLPLPPESIKRLEDMNVTFFAPEVIGTMNIISHAQKVSYTFAYDLSTQKVSEFAISN